MTHFRQFAIAKFCATVLGAALVFQPPAVFGATITPTLAEIPIQGLDPVKSNIMFTMDESGSMANYYLPDYVAESAVAFCRDNLKCGQATNTSTVVQWDPPIASSAFNRIYYDPAETYSVGKRADATDLAYEKAAVGTWTQVLTDPYANYPSASSSATINLAPLTALATASGAYPDSIWCRGAPTAAQQATADSDGSYCRRNGRAYLKVTIGATITPAIAAGYNYPNATNPPVTCVAGETCKFTTRSTVYGYPYYYTLSQVQFCSAKDGNGWGITTCGSRWDPTTYKYVRYGPGTAAPGFVATAFTRVDIKPVSAGGPALYPSGRTYAQEIDNFAKWYAFDRVRHLAMKAAGGIAFSALDQTSRVGFNTLNTYTSKFLNIKDFTTANKATWFTTFYSVLPTGTTPSIDAMWRIGEYFSNRGTSAGLSGATDPLDPVTGKCQPNFHLLATDGYWNQTVGSYSGLAGAIGNADLTVPALPVANTGTGFTPGQPFPLPYLEGSGAASMSNGMADVGMYYWIHDLRPTLANQGKKDKIAPWQHVVFYGLSIGAEGTIPYATVPPANVNWPKPVLLTQPAIDDLWHAAVNSRGQYFNAQNPRELAEDVVKALADFTDPAGTGAGLGLGGAQLSATNQYGYETRYEPGLWGDVKKYAIDITTGVLPVDVDGNPLSAPLWSAATQLDAQAAVVGAVNGWDTRRRIVTINNETGTAVPFRLASLSGAQQSSLNSGWSSVAPTPTSAAVLNYLRGDRSNEGATTTNFRARTHILGDIAYSGAVPVGAPNAPYLDTGIAGSTNPGYNDFKLNKGSRAAAVYVGGNDGMLHAFDDTTANGGMETWAYVPSALFSSGDPNDSTHAPAPAFQLGALTFRRGGIPLFSPKFYVNATPRVADVDFAYTNTATPPTSGSGDWRTILVGGLGAGARAVYALDVTNPVGPPPPAASADTEATAAARVLWEYTEANLGYVYDAPTLAKTYAYGWVVLVASGYNNPTGKGFLYVLNPKSPTKAGQLLAKIPLPGDTGTDISPTGLSTIRAFTASRQNPYVLQAYGGDLKGNVWRFDLSNPDATKWKAELIATLKDAATKPQPITSGVRIEIDQNNNVDRYLFVGTGKLLDQPDLTDTSVTNTLYVIKDGSRTTPEPAPAPPYSRANLNAVTGTSITGFSGTATGRGWYQDATTTSQKVNSDVHADLNIVAFAFSEPSLDPCLSALSSTLFVRDLATGNSVLLGGSGVVASTYIVGGIAGVALLQSDPGAAYATPYAVVQVTTMDGAVRSFNVNISPAVSDKHRFSWGVVAP